jgi:hypothetical protein
LNCLKDIRQSGVNGSSRPSTIQKAISNDIKLDLWPKVLFKNEALIIRRHSLLYPIKTHLELIMALVAHYDLELHQMDKKLLF